MITSIGIVRHYLITKEEMENYCKGKKSLKKSVNDDLDSMFEDIRLGKQQDEEVYTYFLPKLTEAELKLVEIKDSKYLQTFWYSNQDVDEAVMQLSESDSKYVGGFCHRQTVTIKNL